MTAPATLIIATQDSTTSVGRELKHTVRFPMLLIGSIRVPVVLPLFVADRPRAR